jgi:hypothetical protein
MDPCKTIKVAQCPSLVITVGTRATVTNGVVVIDSPGRMTIEQMVGSDAQAVADEINRQVATFELEQRGSVGGKPNRGTPDRGEPNRGTPNRGEPDRGRNSQSSTGNAQNE